jgi:hypothetical protein
VHRSAALASGFLIIAARTGLPLAISEIGANAGLNPPRLRLRARRLGRSRLAGADRSGLGGIAAAAPAATAAERAGCDRSPPSSVPPTGSGSSRLSAPTSPSASPASPPP